VYSELPASFNQTQEEFNNIIGSIGLDDIQSYAEDIALSWYIYLIAIPITFILIFLWNWMLRLFAQTLAWISIVTVGLMIVALGFGLKYYAGTNYRAEVDCPACGERSKQDFDLSELPIKRLDIEPVAPGANLFEVELPVTRKKIRFKFLTGNDEMEISALTERKKKLGQMGDNLVTTRLQYAIQSIDSINDKNKIQMFIKNMPARDSLHLRRHIDDNEPGIEMKGWMDCPSCHEHSEVRLPLGASFFWPES